MAAAAPEIKPVIQVVLAVVVMMPRPVVAQHRMVMMVGMAPATMVVAVVVQVLVVRMPAPELAVMAHQAQLQELLLLGQVVEVVGQLLAQ